MRQGGQRRENVLGFGSALGVPQDGESLAKHELFQQISLATGAGCRHSSAHRHLQGWSWGRWGGHGATPSHATGSPEGERGLRLAWS